MESSSSESESSSRSSRLSLSSASGSAVFAFCRLLGATNTVFGDFTQTDVADLRPCGGLSKFQTAKYSDVSRGGWGLSWWWVWEGKGVLVCFEGK